MAAKTKSGRAKRAAKKPTAEVVIPDKLYFRIGEVARLCSVPTYVLRFWETEFPQLKPAKSGTGQRMYRHHHVELALRIKQLLYDEGFTIAGARAQLKAEAKPTKAQAGLPFPQKPKGDDLKRLRQSMRELLTMLAAPPAAKRMKAGGA